MSTIWTFHGIKTKHDVCRGKDCINKFCKSLEEHAMETIIFEKKKMISLTEKELESYASQEKCHICKEIFKEEELTMKNIVQLEINVIIQLNTCNPPHSIYNLYNLYIYNLYP